MGYSHEHSGSVSCKHAPREHRGNITYVSFLFKRKGVEREERETAVWGLRICVSVLEGERVLSFLF